MKVSFAAIALCMAPVVGFAADLPGRKAASAPGQALAVSTWTGPYAGLNAGWGFGKVTDPYVTPVLGSTKTSGVLGGLQVGYNHQAGDFVLGVEADYAMANVKGDLARSINDVALGNYRISGSVGFSSTLETFGTVRARAGVTMNSALFYATGGYALGRNKIKAIGSGSYITGGVTTALGDAGSDSKSVSGWVVGGGVEYAITSNISGKLEYLYADLGKATVFSRSWAANEVSTKVNILRAGVNYRF